MPMYATSANELKVYFNTDTFLTFKMHADLRMDLLRWLQAQIKRIEVMGKRADKIESNAVELSIEESARFIQLTEEAESLRSKGGDSLDVMVDYVKRACNGWTDYYDDAEAEARNELLPFDEKNIIRIGLVKLNKVIEAFNQHYGLAGDEQPGEAKGEVSLEPSPQVGEGAGTILSSTVSSATTAP